MKYELELFEEYYNNYCSLSNKRLNNYRKEFGDMEKYYWGKVIRYYKSIGTEKFTPIQDYINLCNKEGIDNCTKKRISSKEKRKKHKKNKRNRYIKYLQSEKWKILRGEYLEKCNNRCACCREIFIDSQLQLHHHTYENLYKEKKEDLVIVCNTCHYDIHWRDGKKVAINKTSLMNRFNEISLAFNKHNSILSK